MFHSWFISTGFPATVLAVYYRIWRNGFAGFQVASSANNATAGNLNIWANNG